MEAIFAHPDQAQLCPFCGQRAVHAKWSVFIEKEPRGASFDAWCENCGEKTHCAAILPPNAPDSFPPHTAHTTATLTRQVFDRGKKAGWWP